MQLGSLQNNRSSILNRYTILKGLDSGSRVITSNLIKLRHGMLIKSQP